jgi:ankyrin repeat protein
MAPKKRSFKKKTAHKKRPASNDSAQRGATTPLHAAARTGDAAAITELLQTKPDINARDEHARTPLHLAAWAGQTPAMEALVAAGADVALGAVDNMTALHFAAKKGADCVACLLAAGAPLDAACERTGKTALHIAAAAANGPVIQALINAGANRALKTRKGESARDLVKDNAELVALFRAAHAAPAADAAPAAPPVEAAAAPETTEPTSFGDEGEDDGGDEDAFI